MTVIPVREVVWAEISQLLRSKLLTVVLLRQFSFSCQCDIESFQTFVIRPRVAGEGPSSLPLLVRRILE
ncbi:hypothetical protein JVT61DRAFT_5790 [Boletus reticuloceps]|uniref:Uncharacterized protein n=1 Tax=Boletus reticuloceps TaxID=495285 RepID=A0A8I3ADE1_9AGAM|nr:hypothetical protein JVT61DRAFT_5790 [Boletus reticuloceps]